MRSIEKPKQPWFTFDTHIWKLLSWKIESSFRGIVRQTRNRVLYHWIYIRKFNDTARFPCTDQWTFHLHKMYCFLFSEHFLEHFLLQLILAWGSRYTNKTTSSRVKERYLIAKAQTIHDVCFDRIRQSERGSQNIVKLEKYVCSKSNYWSMCAMAWQSIIISYCLETEAGENLIQQLISWTEYSPNLAYFVMSLP